MEDDTLVNQSQRQKMVSFATSEYYAGAIELLKYSRSSITSIVGDSEYQTLVNAITLEMEAGLVQRFVAEIEKIRSGQNIYEPQQ